MAVLTDRVCEFRLRPISSLLTVGVGFALCFTFSSRFFNVLMRPLIWVWPTGSHSPELILQHPEPFFFTQLKVALFGVVLLAVPIVILEMYMLVVRGLHKNERDAFLPYMVATPVLFLMGACLAYFVATPLLIKIALGILQTSSNAGGIEFPQIFIRAYLSMIMTLIIGYGIVFQLPVVLTFLARAGLVTVELLRKKRGWVLVAVVAITAVLTPLDPISKIALVLPTMLLYEVSIFAVERVTKANAAREAEREKTS